MPYVGSWFRLDTVWVVHLVRKARNLRNAARDTINASVPVPGDQNETGNHRGGAVTLHSAQIRSASCTRAAVRHTSQDSR